MRVRPACFRVCVGSCLGIALLCGPVWAQEESKPRPPTVFSRLFEKSTGQNGYEEWVQAADIVQGNKLSNAATDPDATLTQKRRAMADPQIQKALRLVREGLNKPALSPHQTLDETTVHPELPLFRQLGRLLNTQIYVCFADGRVDAAIDALNDSLRFGARIQTETITSGLVGVAIDVMVLRGFSAHLDMLSDYQCARVQRLMEEWMEWRAPTAALLHGSMQWQLRCLENTRGDLKALEEEIGHYSASDNANEQADATNLLAYLKLHPLELGMAIDEAKDLIAAHYDAAAADLKRPVKERLPLVKANVKSLGGTLFSLMTLNIGLVVEKYDRANAMLRLLSVHAAVHRYRWEHNSLPNSLAELHLGPLTEDLFTGQSLRYERTGTGYDLFSQGPQETTEAGTPTGKRTPVRL